MTLLIAVLLALQVVQPAHSSIAGDWEGSSLCTVRNSPCHDEHVVYHIKPDSSDSAKFAIDADKIINGKPDFMGTLQCTLNSAKSELYCDTAGDWRFTIKQNAMIGTLTLRDGTLYRNVSLKRKQ